jgi:alcohol dehydrogenase class IV
MCCLSEKLQVKRGLKDFGFKEEDNDKAADIAVGESVLESQGVERNPIRELLTRAWAREPARADLLVLYR